MSIWSESIDFNIIKITCSGERSGLTQDKALSEYTNGNLKDFMHCFCLENLAKTVGR